MPEIKNPQFVISTLKLEDAPPHPYTEFAFVGRSNVGKSSLINSLLRRRNIARVSKQPGKTRTINFFNIDDRFYLVDLPGYGFARISKKEQESWRKAIERYLLQRPQLKSLFLLVDAGVGPKPNDIQMAEWLNHHGVPFAVIATKSDKLSRGKRPAQQRHIREQLGMEPGQPLLFYSIRGHTGRAALLQLIEELASQ